MSKKPAAPAVDTAILERALTVLKQHTGRVIEETEGTRYECKACGFIVNMDDADKFLKHQLQWVLGQGLQGATQQSRTQIFGTISTLALADEGRAAYISVSVCDEDVVRPSVGDAVRLHVGPVIRAAAAPGSDDPTQDGESDAV